METVTGQIYTVEGILEKLGVFSWFQIWAILVTVAPELSAAMITLSPVLWQNRALLSEGNVTSFPETFTTVTAEWKLVGERAWISSIFVSFQLFGGLFGALLAGKLAERYGRKNTHFGIVLSMGLFGFASGWAPDPFTFCTLRFLSGFSVGGSFVVYLNYLMEFLTPSYRTVCGCVSLWAVGEMLLALVGYLLSGWRQILWASSIPAVLVLFAYPWMPESPRWLLCQGRTEEAMEVFDQIARWNGRKCLNLNELKHLQHTILMGRSTDNEGNDHQYKKHWLNAWKVIYCPGYRLQLFLLMLSWFSVQMIYYGVSFHIKDLAGNVYLNVLLMGAVSLPGPYIGLVLNNRIGRRTTIGFFMTVSFCILAVLTTLNLISLALVYSSLALGLCLALRLFISAGIAVLSCFTAESFPTVVRVECMGMCVLLGNVGAILAPQVLLLSQVFPTSHYIVFGLLDLVTVICTRFLTDTTGEPLTDFLEERK